jgi:hypothetical protein
LTSIAIRTPSTIARRSSSVVRKLLRIRGFTCGSGERSLTQPRLAGLRSAGPKQ